MPVAIQIFEHVVTGHPVNRQQSSEATTHQHPELFCVDPVGSTHHYWALCIAERGYAGVLHNQHIIILCPSFWTQLYPSPDSGVPALTCPDEASFFDRFAGDTFTGQVSTILHELVHLYRAQTRPEVYKLSECIQLNAANAARNANNYAFLQ